MNIELMNEHALQKKQTITQTLSFSEILSLRKQYPYYGFVKANILDQEFTLFSANDDPISLNFFWNNIITDTIELNTLKIFKNLLKSCTTFADIGAHVGLFSLFAASLNKAVTIFSFEPVSFIYARLYINKLINNYTNITPVRAAISKQQEDIKINIRFPPTFLSTGSSISKENVLFSESLHAENVQTTSIDNFFQDKPVELIKIDVEHNEINTLSGAEYTLKNKKPNIFIEILRPNTFDFIRKNFTDTIGYSLIPIGIEENSFSPITSQSELNFSSINTRNFILYPTTHPIEALYKE